MLDRARISDRIRKNDRDGRGQELIRKFSSHTEECLDEHFSEKQYQSDDAYVASIGVGFSGELQIGINAVGEPAVKARALVLYGMGRQPRPELLGARGYPHC